MKPGGTSGVPEAEYVAALRPEHLPKGKLSIAVFGPGRGEAIVVRLPNGSVGVVDGCREPRGGQSDPVRVLLQAFAKETGDPDAFRISFVCLTHPHDDHYAGLGRLLEAYAGRVDEVWSVLHATPHYIKALPAWLSKTRGGDETLPADANIKGLERVVAQMHAAHQEHGADFKQLGTGMILFEEHLEGHPFVARACGPSSKDLDAAAKELMFLVQEKAEGREVKSSHDPNLTSGAVLLRWGKASILLAGDLLCGEDPRSGWEAARRHVQGEVHVVNVAHHASKGAHDTTLWSTMKPRLAIVTPFRMAEGRQPPQPAQITALAQSSIVAITSPPQWSGSMPTLPRPMRPAAPQRSRKTRKTGLSKTPAPSDTSIRNAVAVSLDAGGCITRLVLAGQADVYLAPHEHMPGT